MTPTSHVRPFLSTATLVLALFCAPIVSAQTQAPEKITAKGVQALVAKHKGKVVLVNFWATWCPPCVREFPALVKLNQAYKDKGLDIVAISMNDEAEMKDVQAFIKKQRPPFPLYLTGTVEDEFYPAVDKRWSSELPLTMIYDATGKLRYFHNDERTYAQFEKDVQSLLR